MTVQQQVQAVQAFFAWRDGDTSPFVEGLPIPGQIAAYETYLIGQAREAAIEDVIAILSEAEWIDPSASRDAIATARARLEDLR